jgi:hypothetical protein
MTECEIKTWKMTPEEAKEYKALETEKEKVEFIAKIKASRQPTVGTPKGTSDQALVDNP